MRCGCVVMMLKNATAIGPHNKWYVSVSLQCWVGWVVVAVWIFFPWQPCLKNSCTQTFFELRWTKWLRSWICVGCVSLCTPSEFVHCFWSYFRIFPYFSSRECFCLAFSRYFVFVMPWFMFIRDFFEFSTMSTIWHFDQTFVWEIILFQIILVNFQFLLVNF